MFTVKAFLSLEDSAETVAEFATFDEAMRFARQYRDGPFYEKAETRDEGAVIAIYDWIDGWVSPHLPFATIEHEPFRLASHAVSD
jgi:hypothetical protein